MGTIETLKEYGLTPEKYEEALKDCSNKVEKVINDIEWSEIVDKYGLGCHYDTLRKASSTIFGGAFVKQYYDEKYSKSSASMDEDEYFKELNNKLENIRKERIKLQTANIERGRVDRSIAKQELYYEVTKDIITALPLPEFKPLYTNSQSDINYVVGLADIHYGAKFKSVNNEYSPEIAKARLEELTGRIIQFVNDKKLSNISIVSLGDLIQGVLRLSDLKLNDTSIVRATVEICRLIGLMLNNISKYVKIEYYHVPTANHTQLRVLNAKASELGDEDLEYLMGNYIKDLCAMNDRINVHLANDGEGFIEIQVPGNEVISMHGHQLKNVEDAVKDLSVLHKKFYDTVLIGHYHNGKELPSSEGILGDMELLINPSFVGSDPYSDSLCKGSKSSVKIYGFDSIYGHTETYKIILN